MPSNDEELTKELCEILGVFPEELQYALPSGISQKTMDALITLMKSHIDKEVEKALAELSKPELCGNKYCNKLKGHKDMCYALTYTVSNGSQMNEEKEKQ